HMDAALRLVDHAENRERMQKAIDLAAENARAANDLAKANESYFALIDQRNRAGAGDAKLTQEIAANTAARAAIRGKPLLASARSADEILGKAVEMARRLSDAANAAAAAERISAGRIGTTLSIAVILLMIGSTVFAMRNIARPVRRIGEVLVEIA